MGIIELAEQVATQAHAGQFRNDKVTPYIEHPKAVQALIREWCGNVLNWNKAIDPVLDSYTDNGFGLNCGDFAVTCEALALCHDIVEDVPDYPHSRIVRIFRENTTIPDNMVAAFLDGIKAITKNPDKNAETYLDYLRRVKKSGVARLVKIADLTHNLSGLKPGNTRDKYVLAKEFLINPLA